MIIKQKSVLLISISILVLIGCSNSSTIFRYDDTENDSLFVQRDVGAKVFILTNNDEEYSGELLRVRDSTMLLCKEYKASEEDLSNLVYPFYSFNHHDVQMIELRGENNPILGIIFGGLTGALIGVAAGKGHGKEEEKPDENSFNIDFGYDDGAVLGCCIGGFLGMAIGGIIAFNITDDEVVYEYANTEEYDFNQLNIYSRYGGKEPEYLKEIK
jgi:hypothetical protein